MFVKVSIYLDKRYVNKDGKSNVCIALRRNRECFFLPTHITVRPDEWDGKAIIGSSRYINSLNESIRNKEADVQVAVTQLQSAGMFFRKNIKEVAHLVRMQTDEEYAQAALALQEKQLAATNGVIARFVAYVGKVDNAGTKSLYEWTLSMIKAYCKSAKISSDLLMFDSINVAWLEDFQKFCRKTEKQNSVAIHLRNIRTVLNAAIDDGITSNYPFRKFKIRTEESVDKSYTSKELRRFFDCECTVKGVQEAQDMFKLMFCLIGINIQDLVNLEGISKGRILYSRLKTGKPYSIKVVPEALEIIEKYKGASLLLDCLERVPNFKTYSRRLRKNLCRVGIVSTPGKSCTGKAILPDICTGSARTSWATIAQEELDIPRDVIAAALGHHTIDVTSTYLRTDWKKKVDEANRKVLDWVFYSKK